MNGEVVRLSQGEFSNKTVYSKTPLDVMKKFVSEGVEWFHIVNLDGTQAEPKIQPNNGTNNGTKTGTNNETDDDSRSANLTVIRQLIKYGKSVGVSIQIGGGVRNYTQVKKYLEIGVDRVVIGTLVFSDPTEFKKILSAYSTQVVVALDVLDGIVRVHGWTKSTETSIETAISDLLSLGVSNFLVTDIKKDGMLSGINTELYRKIQSLLDSSESKKSGNHIEIIASGGVNSLDSIKSALEVCGSVVVGRSLYEGTINQAQLGNIILAYNKSYLTKRIIPCLDVKNGKVVKGVNFLNLKDIGDPVEMAMYYNEKGADELVFLDITATVEGRKATLSKIREVAETVFIPFTVGGGVKTLADIQDIINAGAEKVAINSGAISNPEVLTQGAHKFGSQCIVLAVDVKQKGDTWEVYSQAGTQPTGLDAFRWIEKAISKGAGEILVTSIDRDGTKQGFDLQLLSELRARFKVPIIASGGAGQVEHFAEIFDIGIDAGLAASIFHEREIEIHTLKRLLKSRNVRVRI